jgi:hypothetical protein
MSQKEPGVSRVEEMAEARSKNKMMAGNTTQPQAHTHTKSEGIQEKQRQQEERNKGMETILQ